MNFGNFKTNSKTAKPKYSLIISYLTASFYKLNQNKTLKSHEEASETEMLITLFDADDPEFEQLQHILNDPNLDPEMYKEIMMESQNFGIQPLKFNQLHAQIKYDLEEDSWMGLRILLNWRPTNLFNTETQIIVDDRNRFNKYRVSATTIVPGTIIARLFT